MLELRLVVASLLLTALRVQSSQLGAGRRELESRQSTPQRGLLAQLNVSVDYVERALERSLSNEELGQHLNSFVQRCGHIAQLDTIGRSVQGVPLWRVEISDRPGEPEPEPGVKFIGNIHGDEPSGRQLLLALAEWLCANYQTDPVAQRVVRDMHLSLLPSMNPDGFAMRTRLNANGRDLNRNFPDPIANPSLTPTGKEEPETKAVVNWTLTAPGGFVASGSLHEVRPRFRWASRIGSARVSVGGELQWRADGTGELVVNFPWDGTANGEIAKYNATPDDATFSHLALTYAGNNPAMLNSSDFGDGITNGAAWYGLYGGMQDWNYVAAGCFEVTLELSKEKMPRDLRRLWRENRQALLEYALTAALGGVWGRVYHNPPGQRPGAFPRGQQTARDSLEGSRSLTPVLANVTVLGVDKVLQSKMPFGDFYRPLAPGNHILVFSAPGLGPEAAHVTVPQDGSGVALDVFLERE